jgi:predicted DNA-binding transcriptional regulator YafY
MPAEFRHRPERLVALIKYLYTHSEGLAKEELASISDMTIRNAEKDFKVLREVWPAAISKKDKRYRLELHCPIQKQQQAALRLQNRMVVKLALDLLEHGADLSQFRDAVIDELELEKLMIPYYIQPEYYETIDMDSAPVETLTELIEHDYQADIFFHNKAYTVEPYKIANFDGIWYLYAKDLEDKTLKTWPIREIESAGKTLLQQKYKKEDALIEKELDNLHSAHFRHGEKIDVKIKVYPEASNLFEARKHIRNQKILDTLADGSLIVGFTVTSYEDMDDIIKTHLPYVEIIEPLKYREWFIRELKSYISRVEAM